MKREGGELLRGSPCEARVGRIGKGPLENMWLFYMQKMLACWKWKVIFFPIKSSPEKGTSSYVQYPPGQQGSTLAMPVWNGRRYRTVLFQSGDVELKRRVIQTGTAAHEVIGNLHGVLLIQQALAKTTIPSRTVLAGNCHWKI